MWRPRGQDPTTQRGATTASSAGSDATPLPPRLERAGDTLARSVRAMSLERFARLAAAASAPLLLPDGTLLGSAPLLAGLSAYVLLTALARRDQYLRAADLVVAAALLVFAGPAIVAFLPFILVSIAGPASQGGLTAGLAAGGTLGLVLLVRLLVTGEFAEIGALNVVPLTLLLPLAGVSTATASGILDGSNARDRLVLEEVNRLLSSLRDIADDLPGGLDVSTVSAALVAELRSIPKLTAAIVLVPDHDMMRPAGSSGFDGVNPAPVRREAVLAALAGRTSTWPATQLPVALQGLIRGPRLDPSDQEIWTGRVLGDPSRPTGVILAGFADLDAARRARHRLNTLATDGHLALDNAQLFDGTRTRATDAARRGIAADLHDGVAQSLAHLRMELELLARTDGGHTELQRLATVAGTALADLRGMIAGLRETSDDDLAVMLTRHVDAVTSSNGPSIEVACDGPNQLDPERSEAVLRIAQEALSNALRHARAQAIRIGLHQDEAEVRLLVVDDGVGLGTASTESGGGVGLASMQERARALHGTLEIEPRERGGTRVLLTVPVPRPRLPLSAAAHPMRRRTDRVADRLA